MAFKTIIIKNTTGSDIAIAGERIPTSDQTTIDFSRLQVWRDNSNVETLINSGDLVINDGTSDLSASIGLAYLHSDSTPNIIYVTSTGSDTAGDGGQTNPYRTIKYALLQISSSSSSNRFMIIVSPAVYIENNPLAIPTYVELFSSGGITSARIQALNPTLNLLEPSGITAVRGFALDGVSSGSLIYHDDVSGSCSLTDIILGESDHGISCLNGVVTFSNLTVEFGVTISHVIHVDGGIVNGLRFGLNSNSIISAKVFHNNSGTLNISNFSIDSTGVTEAFHIQTGGTSKISNGLIKNVDTAIRLATSANLSIAAIDIEDTSSYDFLIDDTTPIVSIDGSEFRRDKVLAPSNYINVSGFYLNQEPIVGGLRVLGNIVAGRPEVGTQLAIGRGDAYTRAVMTLTTDNTATSTTEGGNLTDVSAEAASYTGSTISFQGTTAEHTILFGVDIDENSDKIKFWGLQAKQTTAAVEITKKSFVFERWDGSAWTQFGIMATYTPEAYVYSKELFIRANQTEEIQFGLDEDTTWVKKTINGKNLYWVRVRITNDLTTAPVFEQIKLNPSHIQVNDRGVVTLRGRARYRRTILATGNIFGESGAVTYSNPFIGATGGWNHSMKNNQLNEINDAIYLQFVLPRSTDTSFPLEVLIYYQDTSGSSSTDGTLRVSALPMEVVGVMAADETGGVIPIARTLGDINPITIDDAQIIDKTIVLGNADILATARDIMVDITDAYQGDIVALKIEYLDDGSNDKNIIIWGIEVAAVSWVLGDRI